ncbi:MAG: leucyl aminopeptidase family protein [Bacteroidales bacterium]|nr:leucyl aminopeptidase family protein [Bacteroidales bacterium]
MISKVEKYDNCGNVAYIVADVDKIKTLGLGEKESEYLHKTFEKKDYAMLNLYDRLCFVVKPNAKKSLDEQRESVRMCGCSISDTLNAQKYTSVSIVDLTGNDFSIDLAEGIELANYRFDKYLSKKKDVSLSEVKICGDACEKKIARINSLVKGVFVARDIVNEPLSYMTAKKLAETVEEVGKSCGFKTEILDKMQIESLKMGGLLAVNRGSVEPPTFSILKWEPENAINERPYVLVGKGLVFDTGGYDLKPSSSMDTMKSDKAGGAAVVGTIAALAMAKVPVKVYGLVPATENRIGATAYVPEDIITMYDGTTVEIANTDAEGRLILADALSYAKKYNPELVIDMATLTGAAMVAVGEKNTAVLGTSPDDIAKLKEYGFNVWERLIELPLWDDFAEQLESPIADLKNCGKRYGGTITAAMFLMHFTDYKWVHLDIAGPAFTEKKDSYRGNGGTSVPTRLLFKYFTEMTKNN